jgi:RNA polymerase sigma-70 factor (family 1)
MPYIKLDKAGFEAIYREYWRRLFDFAMAKTQDRDVSEELVQSLFVEIWEKRNDLRISNVRSYLFVSVRNRVIDHYNEKLFADLELAADKEAAGTAAPDYPLFLDELEATFKDALGNLAGKTREIFVLNRLEGKSAKEISFQMSIPERTVEYHITQAIRQLKTTFYRGISLLLPLVSVMNF